MRAPEKTVKSARRLRRTMTLPEVLLWDALRGNSLGGHRFRRQHPVGSYVLDLFRADAKVAVEVDGSARGLSDVAERDGARDAWLAAHHITALRFPATDILSTSRRTDVLETILAACASSTAFGGPPPPLRRGG